MARIVFDLDGTLIDSAPDLQGIANTLLAGEGREPISLAEAREFIGNGVGVFVRKMRQARDIPEADHKRLLDAFVARYEGAVDLTVPYAGVEAALARLGADHALGLCTNKLIAPTRAVLRHFGLAHHFATVVGGDSLPQHKPDPAPLHAAFDALGEGPRLYVGDSEVDAETAVRAKVPFLLFTPGYRKGAIADLPHRAAFDEWSDLPGLVATCLAEA